MLRLRSLAPWDTEETEATMWDPYTAVTKNTLNNGIDVYVSKWHRSWQKCIFLFHCGAKDDPLPGTANFLEHLISKNIVNRTKREIARDVEERGGEINFGKTYISGTIFDFRVPTENFTSVLSMLAAMLTAPHITHSIEDERRILVDEFRKRHTNEKRYQLLQRRRRALFSQHWLGQFTGVLGTSEGIAAIDEHLLQEFADRQFVGRNLSIIACGTLETDEVLRAIEATTLAKMPPGDRAPLLPPIVDPEPPLDHGVLVPYSELVSRKPADSGMECYAALPCPRLRKFGAEEVAARVLNDVLFNELREKRRWSYDFHMTVNNLDAASECVVGGRLPWHDLSGAEDIIDACITRATTDKKEIVRRIRLQQIYWKKMRDIGAEQFIDACTEQIRTEHRLTSYAEDEDQLMLLTVEDVQAIFHRLQKPYRFTLAVRE